MLEVELGPAGGFEVVEVGFVGDDEFACMGAAVPDTEMAPPKSTALVLETIVKVCPKRGAGTSPDTLTFSASSFFIQKLTFKYRHAIIGFILADLIKVVGVNYNKSIKKNHK